MKKIILILLFGCIYCCAFAQQSDSVIIARFANDTAGFRKVAERVNVRGRYERKYRQVKRARIKDDHDAAVWLALNLERGSNFQDPEYKQVEGGWLFVGEYLEPGYWLRRWRNRHIRRYFIGYDHNIVMVRCDLLEHPVEYSSHVTIGSLSYKFPDGAESDTIVEPEYLHSGGGSSGLCHEIESALDFMWDLHHNSRNNYHAKDYVWPGYPVKGVFTHTYIIDIFGEAKFKEFPPVNDTISWYTIERILPLSTDQAISLLRYWSPGSVNGEAVPVEMSITVSCTIDENPEYDKWPHYTWRELLDTQRQNK